MVNTRRKIKVYLMPNGEAHFVDPGLEHLPLLQRLNPEFKIKMVWPPHDFVPNLAQTKGVSTGLTFGDLAHADDDLIWKLHGDGLGGKLSFEKTGSASLLDLKIELAKRELLDCRLCGQCCGINRFLNPGKCGLREAAYVAESFLHIGEEVVLTPTGTFKIFGCGLNCAGCQAFEIIHVKEEVMAKQGQLLDATVWTSCPDFKIAATIEFVGGNPSERLYPILKVLDDMPPNLSSKPLVWNDHSYTAPIVYEILNGVVDVYLPDFKGCDGCTERISKVKGYWEYATASIKNMLKQRARIIVRVLVLPGHFECCHKPSLEWLAQYRDRLWISVLQFIPDFRALKDPQLNRPTSKEEIEEVRKLMNALSLRDVDEQSEEFWKS